MAILHCFCQIHGQILSKHACFLFGNLSSVLGAEVDHFLHSFVLNIMNDELIVEVIGGDLNGIVEVEHSYLCICVTTSYDD